MEYFAELGIPTARICETLGVAGPADVDLDKLAILQGLRTAHRDGETLESLFPEPTGEGVPAVPARGSKGLLDEVKGRGATKAAAEPPEPGSQG